MANPLTTLQSEWAVISDAPWSFLTIAALVAAAVWWIACKYYAGRIAELTEQKSTLEHRVQARNDEIQALNAKLAEALATPKTAQPAEAEKSARYIDPDEIEQSVKIVGKLHGPEIRRGESAVVARSLTSTGDFNPERPFTFRNMKLLLVNFTSSGTMSAFGETKQQFGNVVCKILD
ncbi:hypothetical protein EOJ32_01345 [Paracoccus sp. Arc7-R13]|uniref:hypothetical protein n=1 Tax=Paracoccus sp. Arc7-R13 TaxID=2500532 RepID=UPI000FDB7AD4|nr:hypothetical protein [Paracoccus sp. Arc7-R13]AZY92458.1 hypothetical protein EOJ32_01345 [Paracoccus sp. Arc7-R13]